jgi:hypothetical protein
VVEADCNEVTSVLSHPLFRELLTDRDGVSEEELAHAREILYAPFGLAYCIAKGFRARAEEDLARFLSKNQRDAAGDWRPIEEAPDDLAEGLFAFPDGSGGYVQMVIYGYAPSRRLAPLTLYNPHGVQPDPDEPAAISAKEIAIENGATQWRPIPPHPACSH